MDPSIVQGFRDFAGMGLDKGFNCAQATAWLREISPGFADDEFANVFPIVYYLVSAERKLAAQCKGLASHNQ